MVNRKLPGEMGMAIKSLSFDTALTGLLRMRLSQYIMSHGHGPDGKKYRHDQWATVSGFTRPGEIPVRFDRCCDQPAPVCV